LRGERFNMLELLLRRPDDLLLPIAVSAAPIEEPNGAIVGAVVAFEDITPVKELERLRAEWSAVVAHDLRQPLNTIAIRAQVLRRRAPNDREVTQAADHIYAAALRLNRMIQHLMDLSRLEVRRLELMLQPFDVMEVVRSSIQQLAVSYPYHRIEVRVRGEPRRVRLDPDRIAQVMENLLTNAIKYGKANAPIVVEVSSDDAQVEVAVTNEGKGIAPDDLALVFRRFERTEGAKLRGIQGTGLGLYIARELIEAHGGRISVESTPDRTTTFRFVLPVARS